MQTEDSELIARAKKADDQAFEQLVCRYEANVLHYLIRFVGSRHDALDISQEVWVRVYRSLTRFKEGGSFRAWVFKIARNCAISFFRTRGREPDKVSIEDARLVAPAPDHASDSNAMFWRQIREGVGERPASALWMHYAEGMRMDEIATALGMRSGAVKVMMHRARTKLRTVLGESDGTVALSEVPDRQTANLEVDYVC